MAFMLYRLVMYEKFKRDSIIFLAILIFLLVLAFGIELTTGALSEAKEYNLNSKKVYDQLGALNDLSVALIPQKVKLIPFANSKDS